MAALITPAELNELLNLPNVKVLDASYRFPPFPMGIAGAQDFDIDDVADPQGFPHTVPTPDLFADKVGDMGISNEDIVVVYDRAGIAMAAARAWWMFRLFGHEKVLILDGGLTAWANAGYPLAEKTPVNTPAVFKSKFRPELLKIEEEITGNIALKNFAVLDARDSKRFQDGHIPNSRNIPYLSLVNADGSIKPKAALEKIITAANVNLEAGIACTCGSGVTACVIALALHELGHKDASVYDGSWTEWGADPALPKAKGA